MWFRLYVWLAGLWVKLFIQTGLYYHYSRIVRSVVEYKFRHGPPLRKYANYTQLLDEAQRWKWRADTWRVGWDSFSYPSRVQDSINRRDPNIGDCDDWSLYLAWVLRALEDAGRIFEGYRCLWFRVLTVNWVDEHARKVKGHNVCVFILQPLGGGAPQYAHVSNWDKAHIKTGRYNGTPYASLEEVANDLTSNGRLLGWAVCDLDLHLVRSKDYGRYDVR